MNFMNALLFSSLLALCTGYDKKVAPKSFSLFSQEPFGIFM